MQTIDIQSVLKNATPISPDRKYSLAWSLGGVIQVRKLEDNSNVLGFMEMHGTILKAGFSADMRQIVAENEDGSISIWFTKKEIGGKACLYPDNIVLFMSLQDYVPYININPKGPAYNEPRYHVSLRDFTDSDYTGFGWWDNVRRLPKTSEEPTVF
ncbi:MAG: hypothetical protein NTX59_02540 [Elusimicrobia bacterium]|nr:hypothetical protein [Elusimicrobiota bacterium]